MSFPEQKAAFGQAHLAYILLTTWEKKKKTVSRSWIYKMAIQYKKCQWTCNWSLTCTSTEICENCIKMSWNVCIHAQWMSCQASYRITFPQTNSWITNMAISGKEAGTSRSGSKKEKFYLLSLTGCILEGGGWGVPLFPKSSTPHPSSAAARHVPSAAQLHLNTLLLPNTWLHLPLSKWKISIICLFEYPANEGSHDKLSGGLLCKGEREKREMVRWNKGQSGKEHIPERA